ncbi:MAG: amidohydrolase family protein [Planctomycetota bacterium]|jgi:imidazolonepropionase-like amidohydrolase
MRPLAATLSVLLCAAAASPAQEPAAAAPGGGTLLVRAGRCHTGTGTVLEKVEILIRDGVIAQIGEGLAVPDQTPTLDAAVVVPGLVDAHTTRLQGADDADLSVAPDIRAADGIDLYADERRALSGGVTTLYVAPGERRLVAGLGTVIKTAGPPQRRILLERGALELRLGRSPNRPPSLFEPPLPPSARNPLGRPVPQLPSTRMGQMSVLRRLFAAEPPAELSPAAQAVLRDARQGARPVRVHARSAADGLRALQFGAATGWKLILVDLHDAARLLEAGALGAKASPGVQVVLSGFVRPGDRPLDRADGGADRVGPFDPATAAKLAKAGVPLAIHSTGDAQVPDLLLLAGYAVQHGLPPETALRAITLTAAEICGVADQVGSIEIGKQGDLACLSADPFAPGCHPVTTVVDGRVAWRRRGPRATAAPAGDALAIQAGRFLTVGAGDVRDGVLIAVDGRIRGVGPDLAPPAGAKVLKFPGAVVVPGFLDARSALGLRGPGGASASGGRPAELGELAEIDPAAAQRALQSGITALTLMAERGATLAAVRKLHGPKPVVRDPAAVVLEVSGAPSAARSAIEGQFKRVRSYDRAVAAWEAFLAANGGKEPPPPAAPKPGAPPPPKRPRKPTPDPVLDGFRAALRGEARLVVAISDAAAVAPVLEVCAEQEPPVVPVLMGGGAVATALVRDDARRAGRLRGVIVTPPLGMQLGGVERDAAAVLAGAGIPVAFATAAAEGSRDLRFLAAHALRDGLSPRDALRACSLTTARLLGVDDRLGSLEPGKDCDCVVLSDDPFAPATRVLAVIVGGTVVWKRP